jgi:hypothetical protein
MESPESGNPQCNEQSQHEKLSKHERQLLLRGCSDEQRRHSPEQLHHQDEEVQIEHECGSHHVHSPPGSEEVLPVAGEDHDGQDNEGDDPHLVGRQKLRERKAEPGDTGQHGGHQEKAGLAVEPLPGNEPAHDDQAGSDRDQTYQRVNQRKRRDVEDHGDLGVLMGVAEAQKMRPVPIPVERSLPSRDRAEACAERTRNGAAGRVTLERRR